MCRMVSRPPRAVSKPFSEYRTTRREQQDRPLKARRIPPACEIEARIARKRRKTVLQHRSDADYVRCGGLA
jgi:hypothetical protein